MKVAAIIPAAGKGSRLKSPVLKPFVRVAGKPLLIHTLQNLSRSYGFSEVIIAAPSSSVGRFSALIRRFGFRNVRVVAGGRTRAESVKKALWQLSSGSQWVLVHDAARPFVSSPLIRRLISAVRRTGAAICAVPVTSTMKRINPSKKVIIKTQDRDGYWLAQTPQVFARPLLIKKYKALGERAWGKTDEAALFDGSSVSVKVVPGDSRNIKITTPDDLEWMRFYLAHARRNRL
jgi:2-C-methyl-D-erythritol 4-phosphate cytidylyltransferase